MEALIRGLTDEDLPNEDMKYLATVIGLDAVKKLLTDCPGMNFYTPARMPTDFCKRYIEVHYDPKKRNVRELSVALGITVRQVFRLLQQKRAIRAAA